MFFEQAREHAEREYSRNKRDTQVRDVFFPPDFDGIKDEEFPVSLLLSLSLSLSVGIHFRGVEMTSSVA
jgi:hypothetical protein